MSGSTVLLAMLPEHLLLAGLVALICVEIASSRPRGALRLSLTVVVGAAIAAAWLYLDGYTAAPFPGQYVVDRESSAAKLIVLVLAVPVLLVCREDFADRPFYILMLSSLYGTCLILSADSFLTLFLGLELMAIPVYVLVLAGTRRAESAEAALKYLVLSGAASATLLMGASLLYGGSGSLALSAMSAALGAEDTLTRLGAMLVIVAFFLKAAVVPFHAWAPDAYEAASVPVTAYMSTIVKAGVLLAAVRLFGDAQVQGPIVDLIAILPLASIVWGNLAAMRQQSFRRMIAYSSIAHAGYLFYAFLGEAAGRFEAVAFYVLTYGLMNVLAFAVLPAAEDDAARDRLDRLAGLFRRDPYAAVMIGVAMLSLAGIPPFPGFVAKFLVFSNVFAAGYTTYAVLGLIGSYLGLYFYLRVIQMLFMAPESAGVGADHAAAEAVGAPEAASAFRAAGIGRFGTRSLAIGASLVCLIPIVALMLFPGWIIGRL